MMKKGLLRVMQLLFGRFGLVVLPRWRIDRLFLAQRVKKIVEEYGVDCIIDVGAYIGEYRDFLRDEVGYDGLIFSFEPDPKSYQHLRKRSKVDRLWRVFDNALGSTPGELYMNIMESNDFNSFLEPENSYTEENAEKNIVKERLKVRVETLDEVLPRLRKTEIFNRVFLKIDTQGYDLEVFKGGIGSLDMIWGVQTEVSVLPIYKEQPTFCDSLELFKKYGYEVSGIYSLSERRFPFAAEFDCIFLQKNCDSPGDVS